MCVYRWSREQRRCAHCRNAKWMLLSSLSLGFFHSTYPTWNSIPVSLSLASFLFFSSLYSAHSQPLLFSQLFVLLLFRGSVSSRDMGLFKTQLNPTLSNYFTPSFTLFFINFLVWLHSAQIKTFLMPVTWGSWKEKILDRSFQNVQM